MSDAFFDLYLDEDKFLAHVGLRSPDSSNLLLILDGDEQRGLTFHAKFLEKAVTLAVQSSRFSYVAIEVSSCCDINNLVIEVDVLTEFEFLELTLTPVFGESKVLGVSSEVDLVVFSEN